MLGSQNLLRSLFAAGLLLHPGSQLVENPILSEGPHSVCQCRRRLVEAVLLDQLLDLLSLLVDLCPTLLTRAQLVQTLLEVA